MNIKKLTMSRTIQVKEYQPLTMEVEAEFAEGEISDEEMFKATCSQLADELMKGLYKAKFAMQAVDKIVEDAKKAKLEGGGNGTN